MICVRDAFGAFQVAQEVSSDFARGTQDIARIYGVTKFFIHHAVRDPIGEHVDSDHDRFRLRYE